MLPKTGNRIIKCGYLLILIVFISLCSRRLRNYWTYLVGARCWGTRKASGAHASGAHASGKGAPRASAFPQRRAHYRSACYAGYVFICINGVFQKGSHSNRTVSSYVLQNQHQTQQAQTTHWTKQIHVSASSARKQARASHYSGTRPHGHLVSTAAASVLRPLYFVPAKSPYIFFEEDPFNVATPLMRPTATSWNANVYIPL